MSEVQQAAAAAETSRRREIAVVYAAGVIQGVALVTFPAASVVFTSATDYGLSNQEYGAMFVPQALTAVATSLLGAALTRSLGAKRIYLLGLNANFSAMALLVVSRLMMRDHTLAYAILLAATASLGIGFGFTVPTLNTFAAAFFPRRVEKAVLGLNALLGLGTALAPVFVMIFVRMGMWWGMPILVGAAILLLLLSSTRLPLQVVQSSQQAAREGGVPARFWLFCAFALLYGVCETLNGNWASLYMQQLGAGSALASLALTVFWASVTAGRILFAALDRWLSSARVFRLLPWVVAGAFLGTAALHSTPALGVAAFAVAGLGCSALLPLLISFGQEQMTGMAASVAGGLICVYQVGYGIAAFGVGPLQSWQRLHLQSIFGASAAAALVMAGLSLVLVAPGPPSARNPI